MLLLGFVQREFEDKGREVIKASLGRFSQGSFITAVEASDFAGENAEVPRGRDLDSEIDSAEFC